MNTHTQTNMTIQQHKTNDKYIKQQQDKHITKHGIQKQRTVHNNNKHKTKQKRT